MNGRTPTATATQEAFSSDDLVALMATVAKIEDPVERAAQISALVPQLGGLPSSLAKMRRTALVEALRAGHTYASLAGEVGLSKQRVHQITTGGGKKAAPAGVEAPSAPECLNDPQDGDAPALFSVPPVGQVPR